MKNDLSILVSGASISGLSVAHWLIRYGFKVTIVEKAPHLRPGGNAVDIRGEAALDVAERMGLLDTIRERATKVTGMTFFDPTGKETFTSTERSFTGGHFDSIDIEILRDDLCRLLYEAVGDRAEYLFDDMITALNQDDTGVDVTFANAAPRRFDLVIGADGLRSGVRRILFGADEQFTRYLGTYVAIFSAPNYLERERWQLFCMDGKVGSAYLTTAKEDKARILISIETPEPFDYDHRDIAAQKKLVTEHATGKGWEFPRLLEYMQDAPDFYFDSMNQILLDRWSQGRVVLLGDAGYSVSPATGQGTSVAMIAAYVLAGELATNRSNPLVAIDRYEQELRDYVLRNQELAFSENDGPQVDFSLPEGADSIDPDSIPDFGDMALPFDLKDYGPVNA